MEVLYIPQLDETGVSSTASTSASRYRILKRTPEDNLVLLTDHAVTRVELTTSDPVGFVLPPLVKGLVRDFFVRIVITADTVPEITFVPPTGESLSLEDTNADVLTCAVGVNIFAFTETDEGVFIVNRKQIDLTQEIAFDVCGGENELKPILYTLGSSYGELPTPTKDGYDFVGWYTQEEGGELVTEESTVKTSISELYAHWKVYEDPYVDAICEAKNLTFYSLSDVKWTLDESVYHTASPSVRSGAIGDNQSTTLKTTVTGPGTLTFWWKVSSETNFDFVIARLDGETQAGIAGTAGNWEQVSVDVTGEGKHTIEWVYEKDGSSSSGSDCAWVDDVVWTSATETTSEGEG